MAEKFYAVAHGRKPGVYEDWDEVQKQIHHFPQAVYKKFSTKEEAETFYKTRQPERVSLDVDETAKKFYAVARGKVIGIFTNYDEVKKYIADYPQPMYKKFEVLSEAKAYFKKYTTGEEDDHSEDTTKAEDRGHDKAESANTDDPQQKESKEKAEQDKDKGIEDKDKDKDKDKTKANANANANANAISSANDKEPDKNNEKDGEGEHDGKDKEKEKEKTSDGDSTKEKVYYAVARGHKPGVYATWVECQEQTKDFKGAKFKKFTDEEDAKLFAEGKTLKQIEDRKRQHEKEDESEEVEQKKVAKDKPKA